MTFAAPQLLSVRGRRNKRSAWEETAAVCRVMGNAAHALVHFMQMLLARNEHQQRDAHRENRRLMYVFTSLLLVSHRSLCRREWKRAQREAARQDAAEAAEEEEEIEEEQPSTSQQQADESEFCLQNTQSKKCIAAVAYAFASGVEQTVEERRAAAMELGGKVESDPRKTNTRKR